MDANGLALGEGKREGAEARRLTVCASARGLVYVPTSTSLNAHPPKKFAALLNTKKRKIHELMAAIRENGTASAGASAHGRSQRP